MSEPQTERRVSSLSPPRARFRPAQLGLWIPLCLIHGTAAAWLAFGAQKHFSPLGLFPLLVGLAVGVTLAGLMRLVHVAGTSTIVCGTLVASTVAVLGQHYFSYQEQRETAERQAAHFRMIAQANPDLVRGTPPEPASGVFEYLRWQAIRGRPMMGETVARGPWAWVSWAVDGCLTLIATLLVVVPASRKPYCDRCRTWYSTVRRGTLAASAARDLAMAVGSELAEDLQGAKYRFVHCQGGCGVAGLEICWELPKGLSKTAWVWLSPADRIRLEELLNRGHQASQEITAPKN